MQRRTGSKMHAFARCRVTIFQDHLVRDMCAGR